MTIFPFHTITTSFSYTPSLFQLKNTTILITLHLRHSIASKTATNPPSSKRKKNLNCRNGNNPLKYSATNFYGSFPPERETRTPPSRLTPSSFSDDIATDSQTTILISILFVHKSKLLPTLKEGNFRHREGSKNRPNEIGRKPA